jgi:hypothetical protein
MFVFKGEEFYVYHGLVGGHGGGKGRILLLFYQRGPGTASPIRSIGRAQQIGARPKTQIRLHARTQLASQDQRTPMNLLAAFPQRVFVFLQG